MLDICITYIFFNTGLYFCTYCRSLNYYDTNIFKGLQSFARGSRIVYKILTFASGFSRINVDLT